MATVDLSKVMNLADAQEIYKDLRDRLADKYEKPATGIPASDLAEGVIPTVPVSDVRINGSSILNNGIATIPLCDGGNTHGLVRVMSSQGVGVMSGGILKINPADSSDVKGGSYTAKALVPNTQHRAVFFGLSKVAGVDLKDETVTLGTYPDSSKQAIQKMLGLDGLFGDYQNGNLASRAYAVGETFVMDGKRYKVTAAISDGGLITVGTNCELDPIDGHYVKDTDYATSAKAGVAKVSNAFGLQMTNNSEVLAVQMAGLNEIKSASNYYKPIVPASIDQAVFFGLAKAANADMSAIQSTTVGTYPEAQKAAIQSMLGVSTGAILIENVSGGTPTLTCLPNVRYKCGEVGTLSITPPASGSCEVIFESGSTATLLTVPNTVKFPPWFDATALETGTIYDIIITDGVYGAVMSWAS